MATDLTPNLTTAAQGPAKAEGDAGSITQQPLGALMEADAYLAAKAANARKTRGLRFTKLIPPGPTGNVVESSV